jgi:hypothetical protein
MKNWTFDFTFHYRGPVESVLPNLGASIGAGLQ